MPTVENHKNKNEQVGRPILHLYKIVSNYYYEQKKKKVLQLWIPTDLLVLQPKGLSATIQSDFPQTVLFPVPKNSTSLYGCASKYFQNDVNY